MMKKRRMFALIMGLAAVCLLSAGTSEPAVFSLEDACRHALEHSNQMKNARLDIGMARKKIWETTALGLPQVSGSLSYQNMLEIPTTLVPARIFDPGAGVDDYLELKFGTQHNASFEVSASQLIFQGSYFVALQASRVFLQLSKNQFEKTRIEIKETVSRSYYLVLLSEGLGQRLEENLRIMQDIHRETDALYQAGFLEKTDVDQVMITLLTLRHQLDTVRRQIRNTRRLLKFQMGVELDRPIRLTGDLDSFVEQLDFPSLMEAGTDVTENIDYRILDTQERSQALLLKKEKAEYLPGMSAFFSYTGNAMRNQFNFFTSDEKWFPSAILGFNINIPLFTSGMKRAQVKQAELALRKVQNQKKDVLDSLKLGLARARSEYATSYGQYLSSAENLRLASRIFEKTKIKYQKGMASSLQLSQIHNQYLAAQSQHLNDMYNLLSARLGLRKALNQL